MEEFEKRLDILIVVLCLLAAAWMLMGCQSTRYVAVPQHHTTVAHQRDTLAVRDSVHVHDSIVRRELLLGDTVTLIEHHWHTVYRDRWRDRVRVDSVTERDTVSVVVEVEKPPDGWQLLRERLAAGAVGIGLGVLLALACGVYIRRSR